MANKIILPRAPDARIVTPARPTLSLDHLRSRPTTATEVGRERETQRAKYTSKIFERTAEIAGLPYIPWERFIGETEFARGQHVTLIGRTGRGKSTLAAHGLLTQYPYVVYLGTKDEDPTYDWLIKHAGFKLTDNPKLDATKQPRVIYRPGPFGITTEDEKLQAKRFATILDVAYAQRGWCIYADEVAYLTDLGLGSRFETIWRVGRGRLITLIASTQNPVAIPRPAFDQVTHIFAWRNVERERVKRIAEMVGDRGDEALIALPQIPEYHALYANTDDGEMCVTMYPKSGIR